MAHNIYPPREEEITVPLIVERHGNWLPSVHVAALETSWNRKLYIGELSLIYCDLTRKHLPLNELNVGSDANPESLEAP